MIERCTSTRAGYTCARVKNHGEIHYDRETGEWWIIAKDPWGERTTYFLLTDTVLSTEDIRLL